MEGTINELKIHTALALVLWGPNSHRQPRFATLQFDSTSLTSSISSSHYGRITTSKPLNTAESKRRDALLYAVYCVRSARSVGGMMGSKHAL